MTILVALCAVAVAVVPARADLRPPVSADIAPLPALGIEPVGLDATAYLLIDATTGQVLVARDASTPRPVASTIKLLTALSVLERVEADTVVTVGSEVVGVGGASVALSPGDRWTVRDLLRALLVRSGNDAAEALAVAAGGQRDTFVAAMATDAIALGLTEVVVDSPSGLEDTNRLSAHDLATLARVVLDDAVLGPIVGTRVTMLPGLGEVESRNLLLGSYAGATGVKTGFTSAAGNCIVASARRDGRHLVAVVLGSGPDPSRFAVAARLLDVGFASFAEVTPEQSLDLAVAGGSVRLVAGGGLTLLAPIEHPYVIDLGVPVRPGDAARTVALRSGTTTIATLDVSTTSSTQGARTGLGAGVTDGVYAALRAALADGLLG